MAGFTTRQFMMGVVAGVFVTFLLASYHSYAVTPVGQRQAAVADLDQVELHKDFLHHELESIIANLSMSRQKLEEDEHMHHDDDKEARDLKDKVRVFIWVMTSPDNLEKKARIVKNTWLKRANKYVFFSSVTDPSYPVIGLNVSEGRQHLTAKTMQGFRYVYEHYLDDADWFMKADDDSYVILENLRYFLKDEDPKDPVFFGHHFKTIVKQGYYSGGGGYVLSKEALTRYYKEGSICRQDGGAEDAEFGKCMEKLGVRTANTTDAMGRTRFHCFTPETHVHGGYPNWYLQYDANGANKGQDSISDYAISFHYVAPDKMLALEYYIYHLRPYGIRSGNQNLNANNPNRLLNRA